MVEIELFGCEIIVDAKSTNLVEKHPKAFTTHSSWVYLSAWHLHTDNNHSFIYRSSTSTQWDQSRFILLSWSSTLTVESDNRDIVNWILQLKIYSNVTLKYSRFGLYFLKRALYMFWRSFSSNRKWAMMTQAVNYLDELDLWSCRCVQWRQLGVEVSLELVGVGEETGDGVCARHDVIASLPHGRAVGARKPWYGGAVGWRGSGSHSDVCVSLDRDLSIWDCHYRLVKTAHAL